MIRPRKPADRVHAAVKILTFHLAGREDHASFLGLISRQTENGLVLEWRDALRYESGPLVTIPKTERADEVVCALTAALSEWKARAEQSKELKYAEREGSLGRVDPEARGRALASRAAAG